MGDKKIKKLMKEHMKIFLAVVTACVIAFIGAVLVLIWFVQTSDIGLQGAATFDQWSLASVLGFSITLILWELLFVGLPVGIIFGGGIALWWYKVLSEKQRRELKKSEKKSKGNGEAFECLMFIAYIIYIAAQGNFFTPFGDLPYSYWLFACLWSFVWLLLLVGIPMGVIGMLYYKYGKKK